MNTHHIVEHRPQNFYRHSKVHNRLVRRVLLCWQPCLHHHEQIEISQLRNRYIYSFLEGVRIFQIDIFYILGPSRHQVLYFDTFQPHILYNLLLRHHCTLLPNTKSTFFCTVSGTPGDGKDVCIQ